MVDAASPHGNPNPMSNVVRHRANAAAWLFALSIAAPAAAVDFVARDVPVRHEARFLLADPVRIAAHDIAVRQIEPQALDAELLTARSRWLRFGDDGRWLGVIGEYPGTLRPLAQGGEWLEARALATTDGSVHAVCVAGRTDIQHRALRAIRVVDRETCDDYVEGSNGTMWSWNAREIVRIDDDGGTGITIRPSDLDVSAGAEFSAMATIPEHGLAWIALAWANGSPSEALAVVRVDAQGRVTHSFSPPSVSGGHVRISSVLPLPDGRILAVGLTRPVGVGNSDLYLAKLDAQLQPVWVRRHHIGQWTTISTVHRFDDDKVAVIGARAAATTLAMLSDAGDLLREGATDDVINLQRHHFKQSRDGRHRLYLNRVVEGEPDIFGSGGTEDALLGAAWELDLDGMISDLDIGTFLGATDLGDGRLWVQGSNTAHSWLFDGDDREMGPVLAVPDIGSAHLSDAQDGRLLDGGDVVLYKTVAEDTALDTLQRIAPDGEVRWRRSVPSLWPQTGRWIGDSHYCGLTQSTLECIALSDGRSTMSIALGAGIDGSASWLAGSGDTVLLLTPEGAEQGRLRMFAMDGRMLQTTPTAFGPVGVRHRWQNGDWLVGEAASATAPAVLRRVRTDGREVWRRVLALGEHPGDIAADEDRVYAVQTAGARRQQLLFIDALAGHAVAPGQVLDSDEGARLLVAADGAGAGVVGDVRTSDAPLTTGGTIAWRAFSRDGIPLIARTWRCPGTCRSIGDRIRATELQLLATTSPPFAEFALTALTLRTPFEARSIPRASAGGWSGVFVGTDQTFRGYLLDYLPSFNAVFGASFDSNRNELADRRNLYWETLQGRVDAPTDAFMLTRYRTSGGRFGQAQDATIVVRGTTSLRFDGCDHAELIDDTGGTQPSVQIRHLRRAGPRAQSCVLDDGRTLPADIDAAPRGGFDPRQSGAWTSTSAPNEGVMLGIQPPGATTVGTFFAAWFTHWPVSEPADMPIGDHWFTLQGAIPVDTQGRVDLTIYLSTTGSSGGVRPDNARRVGIASWTLAACDRARFEYAFDTADALGSFSGLRGGLEFSRPGACNGGP